MVVLRLDDGVPTRVEQRAAKNGGKNEGAQARFRMEMAGSRIRDRP
jgi:hypothetical protein